MLFLICSQNRTGSGPVPIKLSKLDKTFVPSLGASALLRERIDFRSRIS